jgi:nicotinate-nucleotide adenylyltransferase
VFDGLAIAKVEGVSERRRIGIYGGTFDPIHNGHLAMASEVAWQLQLDEVLFVVAGKQPLKQQGHLASAEQRLAMVELACADEPRFRASAIELQRPPPSYSFDTITELRQLYGSEADLWFILGADALAELHRWYKAAELIQLVRLAVVERPNASYDLAKLEATLPGISERIDQIEGPHLDIASSDLRARHAKGQPIRYQLPEAVLSYISEQHLYESEPSS